MKHASGVRSAFLDIKGLTIPELTTSSRKSREIDYVLACLTTSSHTFLVVLKAMYDGTARSHYAVYRSYYMPGSNLGSNVIALQKTVSSTSNMWVHFAPAYISAGLPLQVHSIKTDDNSGFTSAYFASIPP